MNRPLVFIESPYAGDLPANTRYLKECILHSINLGENPYASHGFFTQFLDDNDWMQRSQGISLGNDWRMKCDYTIFYLDLGMSKGMQEGLDFCNLHNLEFCTRTIR